jgi:hypothetical protein
MTDGMYYFGCWQEAGHYLRTPDGRTGEYALPHDFPFRVHTLDGGFLPPKLPETEGRATLFHINGWTVMTFWDRSVDKRGACNSSFVFRGKLTFAEACALAADKFPSVWNRFQFPVTEYQPERAR